MCVHICSLSFTHDNSLFIFANNCCCLIIILLPPPITISRIIYSPIIIVIIIIMLFFSVSLLSLYMLFHNALLLLSLFLFLSFFLSCMYNNMVTKASVCVFRTAAHQVPLYFPLLYIYYDAKGDCNSSPFHRIV